jgi:hypothetical protein
MESYNLQSLVEENNILDLSMESINDYDFLNSNPLLFNSMDFLYPMIQEEKKYSEEVKKMIDFPNWDQKNDEEEKSIYFLEKIKNLPNEHQITINSSKNVSVIPENSISENAKNINFKTKLHHKRGRKELNQKNNGKCHGPGDFDNIQRKIQVGFFNFLIDLANDALKTIFGKKTNYCFKDIKYKLKKVVNHNYVEKLKFCKYSDILQMKISPKNRNFGEDANKQTYMEIIKKSPELQKLFDKNYLYIFQKYYCEVKSNENIIDIDGFKIKLSPRTKGLDYLLKKNVDAKEKFNETIKSVYFSDKNYLNNPFIIIHSKD